MAQDQLYDIATVEAELRAQYAAPPSSNSPINQAVDRASEISIQAALWCMAESNRGTDYQDICNAFTVVLASLIINFSNRDLPEDQILHNKMVLIQAAATYALNSDQLTAGSSVDFGDHVHAKQ